MSCQRLMPTKPIPRTKNQIPKWVRHWLLGVCSWLVVVLVAWPSSAWAHRLEAEGQTKKIQKVKIESWFDLGGVPAGARVQVFRKDGDQLLLEQTLDENGQFTFYADCEPLRVVISAGDGHEKELEIRPEGAGAIQDITSPLPNADRSARVGIKEILAGVGFLLGLAAFILSVRNHRRLANLNPRS
jgi:hypothetical protein